MSPLLMLAATIAAICLWYAIAGRAWLKSKPWAQSFFAAVEPIEIALFRKSETLLIGRLMWVGGSLVTLYDFAAVYASGLDWTPVTDRLLARVPQDMRGLVVTSALVGIGLLINRLRKKTTKPVEVVAIAEKDITPEVAVALTAADVAKDNAVAAVTEAKAA